MEIQKHFPADVTMDKPTFLNDTEVDALLYAYFQSLSMPVCIDEVYKKYETRVDKALIPTQKKAAEKIRVKSTKTYKKHLDQLIDKGYIVDKGEYYVLPDQIENQFLGIPLETVKFLVDTVKEDVIKVYIYLGQRFKFAKQEHRLYSFTRREVLEHLGRNPDSKESGVYINNVLDCLINNGLIRIVEYSNGKARYLRLVDFSFSYNSNFIE